MKKINAILYSYSYGKVTKIATFKDNQFDCFHCMKLLNDHAIMLMGKLQLHDFNFIAYTANGTRHISCDYTKAAILACDEHTAIIKQHVYTSNAAL